MRIIMSIIAVAFAAGLLVGCGGDTKPKADESKPVVPLNEMPKDMRPPSMQDID